MKNSNKSLNDLFRSAEADADGNVLSQSEVERLLQSAKRSVPVTQSIGQRLYERLLSTPLKIGMTAMTTAACITLGLIAFWPQTNSHLVNKDRIARNVTYGSHGTNGATQHFATLPANKPAFVVNKLNEATLATAIIPTQPIATADSLQPVELTPDQLAKLGIVLENNGDIDFYTKSGSAGKVIKLGLPPSWGVRLNIEQGISNANVAGLTIPKTAPRLVTEPNGAKRLFSFESDTTIADTNGSNRMIMHLTKNVHITPGTLNDIEQNIVYNTTENASSVNNSHVNGTPTVLNLYGNSPPKIEVNSNSTNNQGQSVITLDGMSSTTPNGSINIAVSPEQNTDIIMNQDTSIFSTLTKAMSNLACADSSLRKIRQVQVLSVINDSGTVSAVNGVSLINKSLSKNIAEADINLGDINQSLKTIEEQASSIQLNHLIPIRIRNLKNAEHPNELIFWYEPSPELTSTLPPSAVKVVPVAQSKQLAIAVYPNPTTGPATIHYALTDAPKAYFSVRNLLGQEVLSGGATSSTSGDATLDLSPLPAGVYLLVTTTDNGERDVERVVVSK